MCTMLVAVSDCRFCSHWSWAVVRLIYHLFSSLFYAIANFRLCKFFKMFLVCLTLWAATLNCPLRWIFCMSSVVVLPHTKTFYKVHVQRRQKQNGHDYIYTAMRCIHYALFISWGFCEPQKSRHAFEFQDPPGKRVTSNNCTASNSLRYRTRYKACLCTLYILCVSGNAENI